MCSCFSARCSITPVVMVDRRRVKKIRYIYININIYGLYILVQTPYVFYCNKCIAFYRVVFCLFVDRALLYSSDLVGGPLRQFTAGLSGS